MKLSNYKEVITLISEYFEVPAKEVIGKSRKHELVFARVLITFWLLYIGMHKRRIAREMNRDHATVCHYMKLIKDDAVIKSHIDKCKAYLEQQGIYFPCQQTWQAVIESCNYRSANREVIREMAIFINNLKEEGTESMKGHADYILEYL